MKNLKPFNGLEPFSEGAVAPWRRHPPSSVRDETLRAKSLILRGSGELASSLLIVSRAPCGAGQAGPVFPGCLSGALRDASVQADRPEPSMTKKSRALRTGTGLAGAFVALTVSAASFTPGNVVVFRVGSGGPPLVTTGNPVFLDEFATQTRRRFQRLARDEYRDDGDAHGLCRPVHGAARRPPTSVCGAASSVDACPRPCRAMGAILPSPGSNCSASSGVHPSALRSNSDKAGSPSGCTERTARRPSPERSYVRRAASRPGWP